MNADELRRMSTDELIQRHNEEMRNRAPHYNVFLDELSRREMVALTTSINRLTWVITGATIIGVTLTALTLLTGA
jgi:hypothetical protein